MSEVQSILNSQAVQLLVQHLTESARATNNEGVKRFTEPSAGVLEQVKNRRHHLIFGRRGSGKSSLLRKAEADLQTSGQITVFCDIDTIKALEYTASILAVLETIFHAIGIEHETASSKKAFEAISQIYNGSTSEEDSRRFIERSLIRFQRALSEVTTTYKKSIYIFIDDFHTLRQKDQPYFLDYLYRLTKGANAWLKIGSIRHPTIYNIRNEDGQQVGLIMGHDAEYIDLDKTLQDYESTHDFLGRIVKGFLDEVSIRRNDLFSEDAPVRLTLASGGVARDCLFILSKAIKNGQQRQLAVKDGQSSWDEKEDISGEKPKRFISPKLVMEDINEATHEYFQTKQEEVAHDNPEHEQLLFTTFERISTFCADKTKTNIFLVEERKPSEMAIFDELRDIRFIHLVATVTITEVRGQTYRAFMLDVSQWTNRRKFRGVDPIEFWTKAGKERMRRRTLIWSAD